jgi:hypothetical protein
MLVRPQGRNWQIMEFLIISGAQLQDAAASALALKQYPKTAPFLVDQLEEMALHQAIIQAALRWHQCVPITHGARHADIDHTMYGVLHSLRLECGTWGVSECRRQAFLHVAFRPRHRKVDTSMLHAERVCYVPMVVFLLESRR